MTKLDDGTLTSEQLANVQKHAGRLLKEASAYGRFPTPIVDLVAAAKLTIVEDQFLDEGLLRQFFRKAAVRGVVTLKAALSKILGLFEPHDRLVMIDKGVPTAKKPFVKLHEAGHGFLPHQSGLFALIHDCEKTLDPDTTDLFEREANVFAVEVMFQGQAFAEEAHAEEFGIKVPMRLAKKFGASNYSAFRRYVATNPGACCVVVLEPAICQPDGTFEAGVRRIVASRTFNTIYNGAALFPSVTSAHPVAAVVPIGRRMTRPREVVLVDRNNEQRECLAEAFDTKHQIFLLIRDIGPVRRSVLLKPGSRDFKAALARLR
jgi:IrrE N-terminal-like domain